MDKKFTFTAVELAMFLRDYGNMPNMDRLVFRQFLLTGEKPTTGQRDIRYSRLLVSLDATEVKETDSAE